MKFSSVLILLLIGVSQNILSQYSRANSWKRYRKEVILQVGASGFLGDLGGRNLSGTDYSPVDLEAASTRVALGLGYRYKFTKHINLHTSFNYLSLSGNDKLTQEKYRNNRNLNFKTNLYELAARIEFGVSSVRRSGLYSLRKDVNKSSKLRTYELIAFVGIAGFYFNPTGKNPNTDEYVNLYSLHTEGQGLPGGPKQYKRIGISIPVGLAFHKVIHQEWSLGVEFNYRITFTDYIDDVSGKYYDNKALANAYGSTSALMADPSKGEILGATSHNADGSGAQRGDKNKDSYMSLQITIGKLIRSKKGRRTKLRSKF